MISLEWTTEKPTKPGWYWYKGGRSLGIACVFRYTDNPNLTFDMRDDYEDENYPKMMWAGPIPEPKEP